MKLEGCEQGYTLVTSTVTMVVSLDTSKDLSTTYHLHRTIESHVAVATDAFQIV